MRLRVPDELARAEPYRCQAARLRRQVVGVREVGLLGVDREAPLDAPELAPGPDAVLPHDGALAIRVESVGDARLLARDQQVAAVGRRDQRGRRAEVEVRAVGVGAVRVAAAAAEDERVARRQLPRPADGAGGEVEGDDGVAGRGRRFGVGVAGSGVDEPPRSVDGRGRPDRPSGRPHEEVAVRIAPARRRRLGDGERLPDDVAGRRVERGEAAAERAAGVLRVGRQQLFQGRDRHIQRSVVQDGGARDARRDVGLHVPPPDLGAGRRINGVDVGVEVAEEDRVTAVREAADRHRAPDAALRLEGPVRAPGPRVEGIDDAAFAGDEQALSDHGRLRLRGRGVRVAESPAEPQPGDVRRRESRMRGRLEPIVLHPGAPAVPLRSVVRPGPVPSRRRGAAAVLFGRFGLRRDTAPRDELGDRTSLRGAQLLALLAHRPVGQGADDRRRGQRAHVVDGQGARDHVGEMAGGAVGLEQRVAVGSLAVGGHHAGRQRDQHGAGEERTTTAKSGLTHRVSWRAAAGP